MKSSEILRRAKAYLSNPERWHQGAMYNRKNPVQVCTLGAICMARLGHPFGPLGEEGILAGSYIAIVTGSSVMDWNDDITRTHAEVMEVFDEAIKMAEHVELNTYKEAA